MKRLLLERLAMRSHVGFALMRSHQGFALPMAIGVMMVLSITTVAVIELTTAGARSGKRDAANGYAYQLAEAGLAAALSKLDAAADPTVSTLLPSTTMNLAGGSVTFSGSYTQPDWTITATGTSANPTSNAGSVRRTVTQVATIQPLVPGATAAEWDRVFQASNSCFTIPSGVHVPSNLTAKGSICLQGSATITGSSTTVEAGGNVTLTGASASSSFGDPAAATGWTNSTRVSSSNDSYATASIAKSANSAYLDSTSLGFSIPSTATILGIQVQIERKASNTSSIDDDTVQLIKAGTATGANKAASGSMWGTSDATVSYGSGSDMWSTTWTPAQVNATNFGVRLRATNNNTSSSRTASVDYIRVDVTYETVNPLIGTSGTPVESVQVAGTCKYGSATAHTPCSSTDGVYASSVTTSPTDLVKPSIDFNYWYANAKPGPMHNCTSGSFPGGFDNNSVYDKSLPDYGNQNEDLDVTPTNTSYDCQYVENGTLIGRIAWNHVSHVMTIKGTIFIDGDVRWDKDGQLTNYNGRAIIYAGGDTEFDEVVCAGGSGSYNCRNGDMTAWDPNANMMIIVAGGSAEYDQGENYDPAAFQGVMWAKDTCHVHQDFRSSGPIICDTILIDNAEGNGLPTFYSWPPLQSLIAGQIYGSFGSASDYALLLGPERG